MSIDVSPRFRKAVIPSANTIILPCRKRIKRSDGYRLQKMDMHIEELLVKVKRERRRRRSVERSRLESTDP